MKLEVLADPDAVARKAAALIANHARAAVAKRGCFCLALSGGDTPQIMFRQLAEEDLPWPAVQIFQVDERVAPEGDFDRNWTHLRECLIERAPVTAAQIHPMPVEAADLSDAASQYAATLRAIAGSPPVLDLVHLGIGTDGHTASLVPGDSVLEVSDADVGVTGPYQGWRRMTLTYPTINRARRVLWLVTGEQKVPALARLRAGDRSIPAGLVCQQGALVLADRAAVGAT